MKKCLSVMFIMMAVVLMMIIPSNKTLAATAPKVLTIEASQNSGAINASGTTEAGVLAVAVTVYSEDGSKVVTMKTTDVNDNNEYSSSIEVPNGNYIVRAANYDGGEFVETKLTVDTAKEENSDSSKKGSPKAGDMFIVYGGIIAVAAIALIAVLVIKNKKNNK